MEDKVVLSRNGDIPPASAQRINKLEILPFAGLPIVAVGVGLGSFGLSGASGGVLEHLDHGVGQIGDIAGLEEPDHGVIEVEAVDAGRAGDDRHAERHELHDFSTIRFITEGIGAFWHDGEIGSGHERSDVTAGHGRLEAHTSVHT